MCCFRDVIEEFGTIERERRVVVGGELHVCIAGVTCEV